MALLAAAGAARLTASPAEASDAIDDPRLALINRLCDLVIPATGTAGGAAVGAGQFVLLAVDHRMTGLSPAALSLVHTHLDAAGGRPFLRLAAAQQTRLLTELDDKAFAGPAGAPDAGISTPEQAWRLLKPAIIAGYYTSQIGASRELVYEPVPDTTRVNFILHADYRSRSNEGFGGDL
jgi:hypothetical protein